ncbi:hypothetical protein CRG98_025292 [Punica granatum]|uniref:Uncharacterized protein n=1 Tax=Punica granatum TaxID=22663 RepID=A0A2I0JDJ2_PUNGR|nr:hypothetical protein CRG98_025292 [Punica granatum]
MSDRDPTSKEDSSVGGVLKVLEALKQASHELQDSADSNSPAMKTLLELETESDSILSKDPHLSNLAHHLANLRTLIHKSRGGFSLTSFLSRRSPTHSISRVAESIESEIQAWIDRETIEKLIVALSNKDRNRDGDDIIRLVAQLERRVSQGFDPELQDMVLKSKLLLRLDAILCDPSCSTSTWEHAAYAVAAFIRFNKDVFVGQVSMAATVQALIAIGTPDSLRVLCSLVKSIKSPLVDEVQSNGEIPNIISFLDSEDVQTRLVAMECILEIGYFGRKEAIEAMLKAGLIEKLVELQWSDLGGDLIGLGRHEKERSGRRFLESHPFASCVARFAVQLEVGEGLRQRERRAFKQQILIRVREASSSDAEAATIVAEVLWGSSP